MRDPGNEVARAPPLDPPVLDLAGKDTSCKEPQYHSFYLCSKKGWKDDNNSLAKVSLLALTEGVLQSSSGS